MTVLEILAAAFFLYVSVSYLLETWGVIDITNDYSLTEMVKL